jgi:hypothetical protein
MSNDLLINLVNSVLGVGKPTARNNQSYICPFCNSSKRKLEINFTENKEGLNPWNCWVCLTKGKKLITLFKKLEVSQDKYDELKKLVKSTSPSIFSGQINKIQNIVNLPSSFKSLINISEDDIIAKHAMLYLKKRGITQDDIIKHNIGFCDKGDYKNMIIIPSYDCNGKLNYFVTRSFEKDPFIKFKNPEVSRDIIVNELFINWDLPIILCEGMFDSLAIKRNAIPLLGKNIQPSLMKKLIISKVKKIYIALDKDAMKQSLKVCNNLLDEGKKVYLVKLDEKDPSQMGFHKFTELIQHTPPLTYYDLMELKLETCL